MVRFELPFARKVLLPTLVVAALLAVVGTPGVAAAQEQFPGNREAAAEEARKLDCSDVATQRGAQALFELAEEDRFDLDRDGDGVACEEQPGSAAAEDGTRLGAEAGADRDCMDFASQEEAQEALRADPSDPYRLDPENNGVACEIRPAPYEDPATDHTPVADAVSDADLDCEDFEFQQEAQAVYSLDETDPNRLDSPEEEENDRFAGNGFACEDAPVLESNAETVWAGSTASTGTASAQTAAPLLAVAASRGGLLGLALDLVALGLVASGSVALLALLLFRRNRTRRSG
jgi:hypothetical protein